MQHPLFFHDGVLENNCEIQLDEETARHVVQVLRMQPGEYLLLTDGKGKEVKAIIKKAEKKRCSVKVEDINLHQPAKTKFHLAIAFTKNTSRNEWLLEKATELGVSSIIPIFATRTERERIRYDRWKNILTSALIQSRQYYLPELSEAVSIKEILQRFDGVPQKLIAHCMNEEERVPFSQAMEKEKDTIILIGPEGDFTLEEVKECSANGFVGVNMGTNRLRTETAAMAACAYFNLINHEV